MIEKYLKMVIEGQDLKFEEAQALMSQVMEGAVSETKTAALLVALKMKQETSQEVAGFATAMREKSNKLNFTGKECIDVCGTGGDGSGTFNISTAAAFVVAGAGVNVAKHGNRSVSSKSGSADVLECLGVNINLSPDAAAMTLQNTGIVFMFAPDYHPAMRHVGPVRRELAMKTVFNILGPLTNPAGTKRQLIGTYNEKTARVMAGAAALLEMEHVCFVTTEDKFDEISLCGETTVHEYKKGCDIREYRISSKDFEYPEVDSRAIQGDSAGHNAKILTDLFGNPRKNDVFYVTAANAAMGLYCAGISTELMECLRLAEKSLLTGKAQEKLDLLRESSHAYS